MKSSETLKAAGESVKFSGSKHLPTLIPGFLISLSLSRSGKMRDPANEAED